MQQVRSWISFRLAANRHPPAPAPINGEGEIPARISRVMRLGRDK